MRPLRFCIDVTVGRVLRSSSGVPDAELHRYHAANIERADALLFGRVTYEDGGGVAGAGADGRVDGTVDGTFRPDDLKLIGRQELSSGAVALRYEPTGSP